MAVVSAVPGTSAPGTPPVWSLGPHNHSRNRWFTDRTLGLTKVRSYKEAKLRIRTSTRSAWLQSPQMGQNDFKENTESTLQRVCGRVRPTVRSPGARFQNFGSWLVKLLIASNWPSGRIQSTEISVVLFCFERQSSSTANSSTEVHSPPFPPPLLVVTQVRRAGLPLFP